MVDRVGFEPTKAEPADLQSAPFSHSGTCPSWSRQEDLNPQPTDYKSVALPIELYRHSLRDFFIISCFHDLSTLFSKLFSKPFSRVDIYR